MSNEFSIQKDNYTYDIQISFSDKYITFCKKENDVFLYEDKSSFSDLLKGKLNYEIGYIFGNNILSKILSLISDLNNNRNQTRSIKVDKPDFLEKNTFSLKNLDKIIAYIDQIIKNSKQENKEFDFIKNFELIKSSTQFFKYPLFESSLACYRVGKYEDSLKLIEEGISIFPEISFFYNIKGLSLFNLERYEESLASCDKCISLNPQNPAFYNNKGLVLEKLHKDEDALKNYDIAISLNPKYSYPYYNKGFMLYKKGLNDDSLIFYNKAKELSPDKFFTEYSFTYQLSSMADGIKKIVSSIGIQKKRITQKELEEIIINHQKFAKFIPINRILEWKRFEFAGFEYQALISPLQFLENMAIFHNEIAEGLNFFDFNLIGSNLSVVEIVECYFKNTNLAMSIAVLSSFTNCKFENTKFERTDLSDSHIEYCIFEKSNFCYSDLEKLKIKNTSFTECNFRSARFNYTIVENSTFKSIDFTKIRFNSMTFKNCEFEECNFTESILNSTKITNCDFINCVNDIIFDKFKKKHFIEGISDIKIVTDENQLKEKINLTINNLETGKFFDISNSWYITKGNIYKWIGFCLNKKNEISGFNLWNEKITSHKIKDSLSQNFNRNIQNFDEETKIKVLNFEKKVFGYIDTIMSCKYALQIEENQLIIFKEGNFFTINIKNDNIIDYFIRYNQQMFDDIIKKLLKKHEIAVLELNDSIKQEIKSKVEVKDEQMLKYNEEFQTNFINFAGKGVEC